MGTDGEVGDTCEFFSLPGPTAPGRTSFAPFAPRSGFSAVESPGAVCASAGDKAVNANRLANNNLFMKNDVLLSEPCA
jgi:hypothetical protein